MSATTPEPRTEAAQRILEAADDLFCRNGYDGVSVRDVAQAAGVQKASVFYHFQTKDTLFEAVLQRYYAAHERALEDSFSGEGPLAERIHRVIDGYLDFMETHDRYPRLVQGILASGNEAQLPFIERSLRPLFEWTERALGEFAPNEGPLAPRQMFLTFSAAVVNYFTYAPALASVWGVDPLGEQGLAERRAHLHWLVDLMLERMLAERAARASLDAAHA